MCGRTPTEAHHIRFAQPRALGRKVSDEYTVPVCRLHHRDLHSYGDEASWWAGVGIDPLPIALELWRRSRLTYSLAATWSEPLSDAIPPPAAKVERTPLDNDARDRIDVADCPDSPVADFPSLINRLRTCATKFVTHRDMRRRAAPSPIVLSWVNERVRILLPSSGTKFLQKDQRRRAQSKPQIAP